MLVSLQQCAQWFKAKQLSHEFPVFCSPRHAPPHTLHCNIGCTNAVDTMFSCGIPDEVSLLFLFFYFLCTYCLREHPPGAAPPLTGKVASPVKLHYVTWLRPLSPIVLVWCSWCPVPKASWSPHRLTGQTAAASQLPCTVTVKHLSFDEYSPLFFSTFTETTSFVIFLFFIIILVFSFIICNQYPHSKIYSASVNYCNICHLIWIV